MQVIDVINRAYIRLDYLKDWSKGQYMPGMKFHTTMLGHPTPIIVDGELIGYIPKWLQKLCNEHGFNIVGTDVRRGTYILEVKQ